MSAADVLVLLAYVSLLVEMTLLPIPSEASAWQLLLGKHDSADGALARARRAPLWCKILLFFVPTAVGVLLFLVPLCCIVWPAARAQWATLQAPTLVGVGVLFVGLGRITTLVATVQLRAQRRAGGGPPQGLFRWSRNPGLCGMFVLYVGLCLVSGVPWMWVGLPLYFGNMHNRVRMEEANLRALHGKVWSDYEARVPRYLGPRRLG